SSDRNRICSSFIPCQSPPAPESEQEKCALNDFCSRATNGFGMTEIKTDILATLRTQEAALLAVLETVRQAIQTVLAKHPGDAMDGLETTADDRRLMNQVLAEL